MGSSVSVEENRRQRQDEDAQQQAHQQALEKEVELAKLSNLHEQEVFKDKDAERRFKLEEKKLDRKYNLSMRGLEVLQKCIDKVQEPDMNFSLCSQQVVQSVTNGTPLHEETFQLLSSKVPALPSPNIDLKELVRDVMIACDEADSQVSQQEYVVNAE